MLNYQSQQHHLNQPKEQTATIHRIEHTNRNQYATINTNIACDRSATIQKFQNKCIEAKQKKMHPHIQIVGHKVFFGKFSHIQQICNNYFCEIFSR